MSDLMTVCRSIKTMSHADYCRNFLDIKTEAHSIDRMVFSQTQDILDEVYTRQMKAGRGVAMIVLKGHKIRCSTWAASLVWRQYCQNPGWSCLLAADTTDRANILYDMVKTFRDGMPAGILPKEKKSNAKIIELNGWKSYIKIASANEGEGLGRGATLGGFIATEFPYWRDKEGSYNALRSGFVRNKKSIIIFEGTANGRGWDEELYFRAKRKEVDLEAVFIPFWQLKEYRMAGAPLGHLDEEERTLKNVLKLDDEQLRWRRNAIENNCGGSLDKFHQEFPAFDHEAYLSSGTPYFNLDACNKGAAMAFNPMMAGRLHMENGKVAFEAIPRGHLQIWEYPVPGENYIIPADVAGARTAAARMNDKSVAYVFRVNPLRMVAAIKYNAYEDIFANDLMMLGEWYNHAMLAPENNNVGHAVVLPLREKYDNLYSMQTEDRWYPHYTEYPGWRTDGVSRDIMLNRLHQIVREHPEVIPDKDFWHEAQHFVRTKNGRVEADQGFHDDAVMTAAIGVSVWSQCKSIGTHVVSRSDGDQALNIGGKFIYKDGKHYADLNMPDHKFEQGVNVITAEDAA